MTSEKFRLNLNIIKFFNEILVIMSGLTNYWIFQAVPERYDLRDVDVFNENKIVTWYATRYRPRMQKGDVVFLWLGGPPDIRGIYGWGKLVSTPYLKPQLDSYGVDVKYEKRFKNPILVELIKADPLLQNLLILRAPQATNFLLSESEARAIIHYINSEERPEVEEHA